MQPKAFSAYKEQVNTGDSLLVKYFNTVFNVKITLLHSPCLTKPSRLQYNIKKGDRKSDKQDSNNLLKLML